MYLMMNIIGSIIFILLFSLLSGLLLQISAKYITKIQLRYWFATKLTLLATIISSIIGFFAGFIVGFSNAITHQPGLGLTGTTNILLMIIGFFISAAIYSHFIKYPTGEAVPFSKACLISLFQLVMASIIVAILFGAIFLIFLAAR